MIKSFLILSTFFLFFTENVISLPLEEKYNEAAARNYINDSSIDFMSLYDIMALYTYDIDEKNFVDALISRNMLENVVSNLDEMARYAYDFPYETYTDVEVKEGIQNLRTAAYLYVLRKNYFDKIMFSTRYLQDLGTTQTICQYKNPNNCELTYHPDIANVISKSNNDEELIYYWTAWRDKSKRMKFFHLLNFLDWFQQAAKLTKVSSLRLWYNVYKEENIISEMEKVMNELLPFYKKLHAYIRYSLTNIKGTSILEPNGLIPHHLIEQVLAQNWKSRNNIEIPYPEDELVQLDEKIAEKNYDARKFIDIANDFYKSIGFEDLPEKFWSGYFKVFPDNVTTSNCRAEIFDETPTPYLKYCPQTDFRKFLQNHGWMAPIHYAYQKKDLNFAYFQSYKFASPVGEAVILSASTPKYLDQMGIISSSEYTEKQFINRLFKMGVHTLFNVPMFFVHSKVINDLLAGEVEFMQVNNYYWNLMEKYAGVIPPVNREDDSIDFPEKFYQDLENNYQTNKFVSEIVGYQIYKGLCEKSGKFSESNPDLPLHNCNFYQAPEAGAALKEMMKLGSTKPWRQVLKVVTGDENGLCAHSMLRYYEPLQKWLDKTIKEKNIIVGW